jgi:hypothetical protein
VNSFPRNLVSLHCSPLRFSTSKKYLNMGSSGSITTKAHTYGKPVRKHKRVYCFGENGDFRTEHDISKETTIKTPDQQNKSSRPFTFRSTSAVGRTKYLEVELRH